MKVSGLSDKLPNLMEVIIKSLVGTKPWKRSGRSSSVTRISSDYSGDRFCRAVSEQGAHPGVGAGEPDRGAGEGCGQHAEEPSEGLPPPI